MRKVTREEFYTCIYSYQDRPLQKVTCMCPYRVDTYVYWEEEVGIAYPDTEEYFLNV